MSRWGEMPPDGGPNAGAEGGGLDIPTMIAKAKAKAAAIAARLSGQLKGGGPPPANNFPVSSGVMHGDKIKSRINIPVNEHPDINFLGLLIGPQGKTIKEMQQTSGARFMIRGKGSSRDGNDEDPDMPLHVLIIADTPDQMAKGSKMINDLLFDHDKLYAKKREQLSELDMPASLYDEKVTANFSMPGQSSGRGGLGYGKSKDIRIPNDKVGLVIGRGGETIKNLQADTGAKIQIAKDTRPGSPNRVVTLSGSEEQIVIAEKEVRGLIESRMRQQDQRTNSVSKTVDIPQDKVGLLIGKGGETIRQLQASTGCRIQVTRDSEADRNSSTRPVSLQGTEQQVAHAESEIDQLMNQQPGQAAPRQQHPAYGAYGGYGAYPYPYGAQSYGQGGYYQGYYPGGGYGGYGQPQQQQQQQAAKPAEQQDGKTASAPAEKATAPKDDASNAEGKTATQNPKGDNKSGPQKQGAYGGYPYQQYGQYGGYGYPPQGGYGYGQYSQYQQYYQQYQQGYGGSSSAPADPNGTLPPGTAPPGTQPPSGPPPARRPPPPVERDPLDPLPPGTAPPAKKQRIDSS
mmetsp:Transcript_21851/g.32557  ORF Transcript_21851/g.32557 Transcript_21851/m.32557 type:complete len:571 (+) Transcript_21851:121-1833(+)|eukprot:CAMPEP_0167760666 /NCGR_PEP_ID=MMETSP0110_2-20121227/11712_1 /TAXON_ID=629695 /ORGANISM="Gymnochlora sp., Strain CCMP2014" /LENGTH=570 /DNA_ID=CAMNT_0007647201 /DNA_START=64 /DNA_END=1776 /DNA_ORIENTATION=-